MEACNAKMELLFKIVLYLLYQHQLLVQAAKKGGANPSDLGPFQLALNANNN